jgi:eukaryotic-like serine/threonine-protein kinase
MARDFLALVQQQLGTRYRLEREIGRGGGARVFLATTAGGERVALKVLLPELLAGTAAERFLREIRLVRALEHPRIARILDAGEDGWVVYYAMTFADGPTLRSRLDTGGALAPAELARVADDLLDALGYAHRQGIVHRDVKPENVVLAPAGAMLLDFGIARAVEQSAGEKLTATGMTVGTAAYMSPEQIRGGAVDHRSDLYAAGCLLYECASGASPFHHANDAVMLRRHLLDPPPDLRTVRPDAPAELAAAIQRALAKQPDDRWPSAEAMREAIGATRGAARES